MSREKLNSPVLYWIMPTRTEFLETSQCERVAASVVKQCQQVFEGYFECFLRVGKTSILFLDDRFCIEFVVFNYKVTDNDLFALRQVKMLNIPLWELEILGETSLGTTFQLSCADEDLAFIVAKNS